MANIIINKEEGILKPNPVSLTKEMIDRKEYVLPEGYEIIKKPDPKEELQKEITRLEEELAQMNEPGIEELIEYGRMCHPYYSLKNNLEMLKSNI